MSANNPPNDQDDKKLLIAGHRYDGIREYDNPMPGWWRASFWASGVFAILYCVGYFWTGSVDDYTDDLNQSLEELAAIRANFESSNPTTTLDEATLAEYALDAERIAVGQTLYTAQCAACHAADGGGLIGPNFADEYWLHGGSNMDIYNVINEGVLDKGMPAWEAVYTQDERANLVAYIRSLQGTTPASPKEPQGELYQPK